MKSAVAPRNRLRRACTRSPSWWRRRCSRSRCDSGEWTTVTGEAEVDAPLVGRQAEAAVRELAMVVLRREDDVLRRWLGSPD